MAATGAGGGYLDVQHCLHHVKATAKRLSIRNYANELTVR
jgi:hypothetical protein